MADNYRALTRTYRPQVFEDIVSQEHVSSTLRNAIAQNRLSHAYMFCGPRGVGKTTMARVLARSINQIDETVDGESLSQTLNVVEIDAASNNKVEDIHHLRDIVRIPPQSGRYKIFIIDEVHMLSKAAFNALLKTLEEPPPHAIFIFATTEPHKVLPTILSRVQRFDFKRISVDEIVARLQVICKNEGIDIDNESLHTIAKKADGALRDALGLMDQAIAFCGTKIEYKHLIEALNVVGNDQLFEFTKAVSDRDSDTGLKLIDRLLKDGIDIQEFLVSLTGHIRNLYVAKQSERMYLVEATSETKNRYIDTAKIFTENDLMRTLHLVSEAQMKIRDVQQPRVHFEILMLKLIHMGRSKEVHQLLEGLDQLKKKIKNPDPDLKNSEHLRERDQTSEEKSDGVINSESVQTPNSISEGRSSTSIERKGRHSSSDKAESEKRFNDKSSDNGRPHDQNENRLSTTTENNSIENSNDESGSKPDIKSSISESKNHDVATDDDHFMGRPRLGIEKKE
ncbi:MAG: DNA polymerase III subunit gamma/tau, partial [Balneolaceae bacterium]